MKGTSAIWFPATEIDYFSSIPSRLQRTVLKLRRLVPSFSQWCPEFNPSAVCRIYGGHSGTGWDISPIAQVFSFNFHSIPLSMTRVSYNGTVCRLSTKAVSLHRYRKDLGLRSILSIGQIFLGVNENWAWYHPLHLCQR